MHDNTLYYGDNLDVLQHHIGSESVDLIYLDPPFNSNATYNVLFTDRSGEKASAQLQAFKDTWSWKEAVPTYEELTLRQDQVGKALRAFGDLLPHGGLLAYLVMMAPRLAELHRVLKPTGSIYLHCDPTASHYIKVLMDAIFGPRFYRSEIAWRRSHGHNSAIGYGASHDVLLFYSKTESIEWNQVYHSYDPEYLEKHYGHVDSNGRRYKHENPTGAGISHGATGQPWRGIDPTAKGRHWAKSPEEMDRLDAKGLIYWPPNKGAWPYIITYLDDVHGIPVQDIWTDIPVINMVAKERLGYPTQKPEALLERIILASSNEGDVVLDPFCGCGTAIAVSQRLNRRWIGIDITQAAIQTIKQRLGPDCHYQVIGEPTTVEDAERLADDDKYQFQWWATGLVGARPAEEKKGADSGIDGRLYFRDLPGSAPKQVVISVKAGHVSVGQVRDLIGVMKREGANIGVFISLLPPTAPMVIEAASAGFYDSPWGRHPRVQILTIEELLAGKKIDMPQTQGINVTFPDAPKVKRTRSKQPQLDIEV